MTAKKYMATYEIEVQTPLHDRDGNLVDLGIAPKMIEEVGHVESSGAGFGLRDAEGSTSFESPEIALQWKEDALRRLQNQFPKALYPEERPRTFVGIRVWMRDEEELDGFYLDLVLKDGEFFAEGEDDNYEEVSIPFSEIQMDSSEPLTADLQAAFDQAGITEVESIRLHHKALGPKF